MSLKGLHIVVTGASRGIGEASVRLLSERGASLSLLSRDSSRLQKLAESLKSPVFCQATDVADEKAVKKFFVQASEKLGPIDGLVNNAAILKMGSLSSLKSEDLHSSFEANVYGSFYCAQSFLAQRRKNQSSIVNISSLGGIQNHEKFSQMSVYCATKAAVIGMTESWAVELKAENVRVNCVAPGGTETDMLKQAFPDFKARLQPRDIAKLIAFLLDPEESGMVTGTTLQIGN